MMAISMMAMVVTQTARSKAVAMVGEKRVKNVMTATPTMGIGAPMPVPRLAVAMASFVTSGSSATTAT